MEKRTTAGSKGQVVIPEDKGKDRDKEYSAVIGDIIDDTVRIWKTKPESVPYVDFYSAICSRKLDKKIDIKKILEEGQEYTCKY
ncbi:MAG: hypothetical protein B2I17_01890 [Thermoplasmatales archaeon B_DKE]|nr:MAG: hypothetical protein B2I17_01890 [Thermoplasmatales archaeon B_DKE]